MGGLASAPNRRARQSIRCSGGTFYPDDVKLEMGLIVARDGRAFQFALEWWYDEEGNEIASSDHAWVSEWEVLLPSRMGDMDREIEAVAQTVLREVDS